MLVGNSRAANSGLPTLCVSHSCTPSDSAVSGGDAEPVTHPLVSPSGPRRGAGPPEPPGVGSHSAGPTVRQARLERHCSRCSDTGSLSLFSKARDPRFREWNELTRGHTRKPRVDSAPESELSAPCPARSPGEFTRLPGSLESPTRVQAPESGCAKTLLLGGYHPLHTEH